MAHLSFASKWKKRSSSSKAADQAVSNSPVGSPAVRNDSRDDDDDDDNDDEASYELGSSIAFSKNETCDMAKSDSCILVKMNDDSVLLEQAEKSLRLALDLIEEAQVQRESWVDANNLIDWTAAALDDAGLALRSHRLLDGRQRSDKSIIKESFRSNSIKSSGNKPPLVRRLSRQLSGIDVNKHPSVRIQKLADQVVEKRRSLLGNNLVHDADGIWAKTVYGKAGDGLSFRTMDDFLPNALDSEMKEDKALVAWSSQTGTAHKFAKHLYKQLGGSTRCALKSLRELTPLHIARYKRAYFICSTYGKDRPPTNGEVFFSLLQLEAKRYQENTDDLSEGDERKPLEGTSVAVAALGSTAYTKMHFAKFGYRLSEELVGLGATMALDVTTVDAKNGKTDQKNEFQAWADTVVEMEKERLAGWVSKKPKSPVLARKARHRNLSGT